MGCKWGCVTQAALSLSLSACSLIPFSCEMRASSLAIGVSDAILGVAYFAIFLAKCWQQGSARMLQPMRTNGAAVADLEVSVAMRAPEHQVAYDHVAHAHA